MKFSTIAFAAGAAAAAVKRQDNDTIYQVTNFQAACIAHSTQCNYAFDVFQPGTMQTEPQHCSATVTADVGNELPGMTDGQCEYTSKTFKIIKSTDGLALFVSAPVSPISNTTGVHQINNSELEMVVPAENPNGAHQVYIGSTSFPLLRPQYE